MEVQILEHFDTGGGETLQSGGGGEGGAMCALVCHFLVDDTKPQSVGNTFVLRLPQIMDTKTFSSKKRPDVTISLIVALEKTRE